MSHPDELFMEEALREAQRALALGEVPVGAVVVHDGQIVGRGCNRPISAHDPTAHAEDSGAARSRPGRRQLSPCRLRSLRDGRTCAMCAGAITHARIRRLIYGAEDPKAGAVHSMLQVLNHPKLNHQVKSPRECWLRDVWTWCRLSFAREARGRGLDLAGVGCSLADIASPA